MKPTFARALLVVAVFAVFATVTAAEQYLYVAALQQAPTGPKVVSVAKPVSAVFWASLRYYLAWALVAPGVFWISRRIPVLHRRWWLSVAVHLAIPIVAAIPFFAFRMGFNALLTFTPPPVEVLWVAWRKILSADAVAIAPTYWALVVLGTMLGFVHDEQARRLRAVELSRSLSAAQRDALQMQLQPHFLFNTLNAIGSLAHAGDTGDIVKVVDHLGTLLRLAMESGNRQLVPLRDDLRMLDAYLAIEEVRFGDRLRVSRRIDPSALDALVPTLILQPVVENAIVHGIGGRIDAGSISVSAHRDGDVLALEVTDDGAGVPPGWTWPNDARRGLGNVRDRLVALYGDAASMDVASPAGGGTVARLRIPWAQDSPVAEGGSPCRRS